MLIAAFGWLISSDAEPYYEGRSLHDWAIDIDIDALGGAGDDCDSVKAFRHFGTNALPFLLARLQDLGPSPEDKQLDYIWSRLPLLNNTELYIRFMLRTGIIQSSHWEGFRALGAQAKPAIPELQRLMCNTNTPSIVSERAIVALGLIGQDAFLVLSNALIDPKFPNQENIVWAMAQMKDLGERNNAAVGMLINCLKSDDIDVAAAAAISLGNLKLEPDLAIPALKNAFQGTRSDVRVAATIALGEFVAKERTLIPFLTSALTDTNREVQHYATNALLKIAPEILAHAPPR